MNRDLFKEMIASADPEFLTSDYAIGAGLIGIKAHKGDCVPENCTELLHTLQDLSHVAKRITKSMRHAAEIANTNASNDPNNEYTVPFITIIEELNELIYETARYAAGAEDKVAMEEELADVFLSLGILMQLCNISQPDLKKAIAVKSTILKANASQHLINKRFIRSSDSNYVTLCNSKKYYIFEKKANKSLCYNDYLLLCTTHDYAMDLAMSHFHDVTAFEIQEYTSDPVNCILADNLVFIEDEYKDGAGVYHCSDYLTEISH